MFQATLEKQGRYTYIVIDGEIVRCASRKSGEQLLRLLTGGSTATPPARKARRVAPDIEEIAQYMVRGFHDWSAKRKYYLEPGFRHLVGQGKRVISVNYSGLRDDWEDDCRRAFDAWEALGFKFKETQNLAVADIVVDDEKKGATASRRMTYGGRKHNGRPVVHTSSREINIWKEWPEQNLFDAILHEIGHTLGLGHPGPYDGAIPKRPRFKADHNRNTIMSYFSDGPIGKLGDADKLAIEMIYDG